MKRNNKPKTAIYPIIKKEPRLDKSLIPEKDEVISWHLGSIDLGGNWAWTKVNKDTFISNILSKVKNFETMPWNEILNRNSHEIKVSQICRDAQKRLAEIKRDDTETLISLRLSGRERIWGIRYNNILKIIWWDPNHLVYPSNKKHT